MTQAKTTVTIEMVREADRYIAELLDHVAANLTAGDGFFQYSVLKEALYYHVGDGLPKDSPAPWWMRTSAVYGLVMNALCQAIKTEYGPACGSVAPVVAAEPGYWAGFVEVDEEGK